MNIPTFNIFILREDIKDLPLYEQHRKYFYFRSDMMFKNASVGGNNKSIDILYVDEDYVDEDYI